MGQRQAFMAPTGHFDLGWATVLAKRDEYTQESMDHRVSVMPPPLKRGRAVSKG